MRSDGSKAEIVIDMDINDANIIDRMTIEKDQIFFTRSEGSTQDYLIKKVINGEEMILATGVLLTSLNKEGDWLFYSDRNKVYKISANGGGKPELIYMFKEENQDGFVDSILLNNGAAFVTSQGLESVYIKQDGTIIELGKIIKNNNSTKSSRDIPLNTKQDTLHLEDKAVQNILQILPLKTFKKMTRGE
jgi:hypothetical protein